MKLEFSLTEARPTTHRERAAVEISLLLQKVEQPLEPCGRRKGARKGQTEKEKKRKLEKETGEQEGKRKGVEEGRIR